MPGDATSGPSAELVAEALRCFSASTDDPVDAHDIAVHIARFAAQHAARETARMREAMEAALRALNDNGDQVSVGARAIAADALLRAALGPPGEAPAGERESAGAVAKERERIEREVLAKAEATGGVISEALLAIIRGEAGAGRAAKGGDRG